MDQIYDINTYEELLYALQRLSQEQLQQQVQITSPFDGCSDEIVELMPVLAIGTVEDLEFFGTRSVVDNKYHSEEIVMLTDLNPYAENGAFVYDLESGDPIHFIDGRKTVKEDQERPNYE